MALGPNQLAWVEALESGQYAQASESLEVDGEFCCLGVACIVAEKQGVPLARSRGHILGGDLGDQPAVMEWLGLKNDNGRRGEDMRTSLVSMNDDGVGFCGIAEIIRAEPEILFKEPK